MASHTASARASALLSIADVAVQLQLSTKTVHRMIKRGDLPAHRLGRQIRITLYDLLGLMHRTRAMVSTQFQ